MSGAFLLDMYIMSWLCAPPDTIYSSKKKSKGRIRALPVLPIIIMVLPAREVLGFHSENPGRNLRHDQRERAE